MYNQAVPDLPHSQCTIRLFPISHVLNVQSGSSRPPMFSMYNQAVPNLACPQHTIRQFTTYVCNVQSGSSDFPCSQCTIRQFPTSHAPIYNLAASDLPCSQYTVPDLISSQGTIIRQYALNIAVPNLPCSQCTIWQFPTSQQVTPFRLISSHGQSQPI